MALRQIQCKSGGGMSLEARARMSPTATSACSKNAAGRAPVPGPKSAPQGGWPQGLGAWQCAAGAGSRRAHGLSGRGGHFHVGSPMAFGPAGRAGDCHIHCDNLCVEHKVRSHAAPPVRAPGPLASINPGGLPTDSSRIVYLVLLIAYASSIWNSIANG
jgi:hypothetical protein